MTKSITSPDLNLKSGMVAQCEIYGMLSRSHQKDNITVDVEVMSRAQFFKSNPVGFRITDWIKSWKWVFQKQKRDSELKSDHVILSYI